LTGSASAILLFFIALLDTSFENGDKTRSFVYSLACSG